MPKIRLTDRGLKGLSTDAAQQDFWDELTPGLHVRVSGKTGRKTWYVRYRANGTHRRMKLGLYPHVTLADARDKAREAITAADAGEDPAREREERKATDTSFKAMAREVLDARKAKTRESTQAERERILEADLLPAWGNLPAGSITRRDVIELVEDIAGRAPTMANRTLALIKTLYNGALDREFPGVEMNPAHRVKKPGQESARRRFLDRDEIRAVWKATEAERPIPRAIFRLALLTAQRIGSVCALRWADIDDSDVWTIPADVFKGKRRHAVPLSSEARRVLEDVPRVRGVYAFPGRGDGQEAGHVVSTTNALARIREASKLPRWTAHDFRRTFRTHATRPEEPTNDKDPAGLGVAPHVADAVLGHKEASLGFDRYTGEPERYLLAEKREALEKWAAFVRDAVEPDE